MSSSATFSFSGISAATFSFSGMSAATFSFSGISGASVTWEQDLYLWTEDGEILLTESGLSILIE